MGKPIKDDIESPKEDTTIQRDNQSIGETDIGDDGGPLPEPDPSPARHEVPIAVVEQRVSNLSQGALCLVLLTGPFLHILNLIPRGVLAGLL